MQAGETDVWTLVVLVLLAVVTVLTRSFFFISSRPWTLPIWAQRGLQYAPIAALAAVVIPEIVMHQGQWIQSWQMAKPWAALAGALWFLWRPSVLGTIAVGMAVYLPLRLGLGWP